MQVLFGLADWHGNSTGAACKNGNGGRQDALHGRNTSHLAAWRQDKRRWLQEYVHGHSFTGKAKMTQLKPSLSTTAASHALFK